MKHFSLAELTRSSTAHKMGITNNPIPSHRTNLESAVKMILDPLREAWAINCAQNQLGTPAINITSGYRGFRLNAAVGGVSNSAHCIGYAFDMMVDNGKMREFKNFVRTWVKSRSFDQVISEQEDTEGVPAWIHIGYKNIDGGQRSELLSMRGGVYSKMTR